MIFVTNMRVHSFDLDHLTITWELNVAASQTERIERYDFTVLRSIDGPAGPFRELSQPAYNTYMLRDRDVQLLHKWRKYFYKIRITDRDTQESEEFGPEWLRAEPDRIALELSRREALIFREKAGRLVLLLPKLTFGPRCSCFDAGPRGNTIGRMTQQNCSTCFNTSWVGGYARPIAIYAQIDPSPAESQKTDLKEHQFVHTTGRTSMFPPLKEGDMIVEGENRRWRVEGVSYTEKHRAPVRQELRFTEYGRDDIKFQVPVNFDTLEQFTPERAYTRYMDIQDREGDDAIPDWIREWPL